MLLCHCRFLDGIHAANRGTVSVPARDISCSHALEKGNPFGMLSVRGPDDLAYTRTRGRCQALEFDTGDYIREMPITVF